MIKQAQRGFTVVELSVVIAVIGILAIIGIVTYTKVQQNATATVRQSTAATIANSLEKYYEQNGEYPTGSQFNPSNQRDYITNYTPVLNILSGITQDDLSRKNTYQFYAYCDSASCSGASWSTTRRNQIIYHSRDSIASTPTTVYTLASASQSSGGSGCTLRTTYAKPGFTLSWYDEGQGVWIFKRSIRGDVTIVNNASPPTAPQTCTFS